MSDYDATKHKELRKYVLANRHDKEAIELLAEQTRANPKLRRFGADETDRLAELLAESDRAKTIEE